jgi:hypothetical protein
VSAGWVAASVRARLLLRRRIGPERAAQLARSSSLREAIAGLAGTAYGRTLEPGLDLDAAQRAVAGTTLLHLRLLSGWLPPGGAELLRVLAAWYEIANVEDRLAYLLGAEHRPPFDLGSLATAWPRASRALTPAELREALAGSAWGDPSGERPDEVHLGLRSAWASRLATEVPETGRLVAGGLALLLARELFVSGRPLELFGQRFSEAGAGWERARTFAELAAGLPARGAWVLERIEGPDDLWRAEVAWWIHAASVGRELAGRALEGRAVVTGAVLLLAADTWRTAAALAAAAGGGADLEELFRVSA